MAFGIRWNVQAHPHVEICMLKNVLAPSNVKKPLHVGDYVQNVLMESHVRQNAMAHLPVAMLNCMAHGI